MLYNIFQISRPERKPVNITMNGIVIGMDYTCAFEDCAYDDGYAYGPYAYYYYNGYAYGPDEYYSYYGPEYYSYERI